MAKAPRTSSARSAARGAARSGAPSGARGAAAADVSLNVSLDGATRTALGVLLGLALLRGILALVPSMAAWGANVLRFVDPTIGGALWIALVVAIVAPRIRLFDLGLQRIGNALSASSSPLAASVVAALAVAALVWLFPDRVQFTGDFRMREGALVAGAVANAAAGGGAGAASAANGVFPQAMPLDAFLHFELPRALMAATGCDANAAARWIGAFEAAAFAICALAFVRALELRGAAAATALAIVLGGAYLGLFTGYGKAFAELCVVTLAIGAFGVHAVRRGSAWSLIGVGTALAIAVAVHRSGIALLPAAFVVWLLAARAHGRSAMWRAQRATLLIALAIPVLSIAAFLPKALEIARRGGDAVHLLPPEAAHLGFWGAPRAALEPARLLDLVNVLVLLSPLAVAIPILVLAWGARAWRGRRQGSPSSNLVVLVALAAPLLIVALLLHPKQGIARDWDVFAPAGVAISLVAAWLCAHLVAAAKNARLARAVAASAVVPALVWLCHNADGARGLERVHALVTEPPARREAAPATTWDFLAVAYSAENRWEDSARACEQAAACGKSPRRLVQWGMVETMRQDYRKAQALYDDAVARNPDLMLGWLGLAATSSALGDTVQCKRAAGQIQRLEPHHPKLAEIERYLSRSRTQG